MPKVSRDDTDDYSQESISDDDLDSQSSVYKPYVRKMTRLAKFESKKRLKLKHEKVNEQNTLKSNVNSVSKIEHDSALNDSRDQKAEPFEPSASSRETFVCEKSLSSSQLQAFSSQAMTNHTYERIPNENTPNENIPEIQRSSSYILNPSQYIYNQSQNPEYAAFAQKWQEWCNLQYLRGSPCTMSMYERYNCVLIWIYRSQENIQYIPSCSRNPAHQNMGKFKKNESTTFRNYKECYKGKEICWYYNLHDTCGYNPCRKYHATFEEKMQAKQLQKASSERLDMHQAVCEILYNKQYNTGVEDF